MYFIQFEVPLFKLIAVLNVLAYVAVGKLVRAFEHTFDVAFTTNNLLLYSVKYVVSPRVLREDNWLEKEVLKLYRPGVPFTNEV